MVLLAAIVLGNLLPEVGAPSARGTPGVVPKDPAPCEVDSRSLDVVLLGDTVLEVLLQHALHCHQVAISELHSLERTFVFFRPVHSQLELALHAQRE